LRIVKELAAIWQLRIWLSPTIFSTPSTSLIKIKRGMVAHPLFSHREPPFCVAARVLPLLRAALFGCTLFRSGLLCATLGATFFSSCHSVCFSFHLDLSSYTR
jgi:hypothetical protein